MASQIRLAPSASGDSVQAFPLRKGLVNISSGVVTDPDTGLRPQLAHCVEDGSLTLTWSDASTSVVAVVAFVAGDDFSTTEAVTVEVTSGVFHFA